MTQNQVPLTGGYMNFSRLEQLRAQPDKNSVEAKRGVAKEFAGLLVQEVLKSMRAAGGDDGLMEGPQSDLYREIYDQQIAMHLVQNNRLGITEAILKTLHRESIPDKAMPLSTQSGSQTPTTRSAEFVKKLWPTVSQAAKELGTQPEAILAVAALETGWGKHMAASNTGQSGNNLFGIKAQQGWGKAKTIATTQEFEHGRMVRHNEPFRAYRSTTEAVADFVDFLKNNPRYTPVLQRAHDPVAFVHGLQQAGYATDPHYGGKLEAILKSREMASAVAELRKTDSTPVPAFARNIIKTVPVNGLTNRLPDMPQPPAKTDPAITAPAPTLNKSIAAYRLHPAPTQIYRTASSDVQQLSKYQSVYPLQTAQKLYEKS